MAHDLSNPRRPRVLVVDDEPRIRSLLVDVIPDMGFDVTAARTAEEAIRAMEQSPADIAILDLQLPVMQGMDLFAQLRERWSTVQVIVMTGFGDLATARAAIQLDVVDFLTKPCHLRDVEVALDRARRRLGRAGPGIATTSIEEPSESKPTTLADLEKQQILDALSRHNGNRTKAAAELGISRRTLHYRLREYGMKR